MATASNSAYQQHKEIFHLIKEWYHRAKEWDHRAKEWYHRAKEWDHRAKECDHRAKEWDHRNKEWDHWSQQMVNDELENPPIDALRVLLFKNLNQTSFTRAYRRNGGGEGR